MAPKKALKTAPKKAAKKAPKKHHPDNHDSHKAAKDARRTFEHLGRVQALAGSASSANEALAVLMAAADAAFRARDFKSSADLLRAAEHLSFATLQQDKSETVAADLERAIREELERLAEKAIDHSSHGKVPERLVEIAADLQRESQAAVRRGSYRAALEYARGAEALAHVHSLDDRLLGAAPAARQLKK